MKVVWLKLREILDLRTISGNCYANFNRAMEITFPMLIIIVEPVPENRFCVNAPSFGVRVK